MDLTGGGVGGRGQVAKNGRLPSLKKERKISAIRNFFRSSSSNFSQLCNSEGNYFPFLNNPRGELKVTHRSMLSVLEWDKHQGDTGWVTE